MVVVMIISCACYQQDVVIVDSVGRKTKAVGEAKGKVESKSQVEIRDVVYGFRAGESKGETLGEPILLALLQLLKFCGTPRLAPVQRENKTRVSRSVCGREAANGL